MKKLIKPASWLLYLLTIIVFLIAGATYASLSGAAKGQGLAGGAIVLGYGVIAAFVALVAALFTAFYVSHAGIVKINRVLAVLVAIGILYTMYRYFSREGTVQTDALSPTTPTKPVAEIITAEAANTSEQSTEKPMGLGFFTPNFYKNHVLYFYGNPDPEKPASEQMPTDSIVFGRGTLGGVNITYAPPWLVPDHLKLDYDMLYFRIQSLGRDLVEVTVNTRNQKIAYVSREAGRIVYWPDFLLNINSVAYLDGFDQGVYIKPLTYAGKVNTRYVFMRPVQVRDDWMRVELLDDDFKKVGQGWIRWRADGQLLISYSLLS